MGIFGRLNVEILRVKKDIDGLLKALRHKDSNVRAGAAEALSEIGDERAVEPLILALKDENEKVRLEATEALVIIGEPAVEPLILALKDENEKVRWYAAIALKRMNWHPKNKAEEAYYLLANSDWEGLIRLGEPAVEPLILALKDENEEVRFEAAWSLGKIGEPAVEPLVLALKDENEEVRFEATEALVIIGELAVEPLIRALKDKDADVRKRAAEALGVMMDERAVASLVQTLKDEDMADRETVAESIGRIGEPAVEHLINDLENEDADVRKRAAAALDQLGWKPGNDVERAHYLIAKKEWGELAILGEPAVEPLIQTLKDKDWGIQRRVAEILGRIGEAAVEPLIQTLEVEDADVRKRAAAALDQLGWKPGNDVERAHYLIAKKEWDELVILGEPAVEPLIQTLKDKDWGIQRRAAEILGRIGEAAVEPLIRALKGKYRDVRKRAAAALGVIKDERAVASLVQTLKDEDMDVRVTVGEALGRIGEPAVEPLIQTLEDKDADVRKRAAAALGVIKDERAVAPLLQTLKNEDMDVRVTVGKTLKQMVKPRVISPYARHLVISPTEGLLAWTRLGNGDTYEVVIFSTESDEIISIYKESPLYPIEVSAFFLGNKRMLVTSKKKSGEYSEDARLTLVDTASGKILSQVKIPNCSFGRGTSDIKTGRFIGSDSFGLTSVNSDNDQLIWKKIDVKQMSASPIFGRNGLIYYCSYGEGINSIDGETKTKIGHGGNCMYYEPRTNLLYAGGGYADHSGDSFLHVISPAGTKSIPFGDDPIEGIKPAGDDMLLLSSLGYSGSYYNPAMPRLHYDRKATVVLFDWKSGKRVWQIDIPDIYISRTYSEDPVLLSNPEEGWALIQTGSFIKQILIKTGEVINTIPKQVNEIIEAVWIPSAHSTYIARRIDTEEEGTLERQLML